MKNNKSQTEEEIKSSKTKKPSICKKALGSILLVTILVLFCILEIAVLIAIFSVFSIFYILIFSVGILYLIYVGLKKVSLYYKNRQSTKPEI